MQLTHSFTVPLGLEEAWAILTDIERIAPCMPGAALISVEGDEFSGSVKVKVGPMQLTYRGTATFAERDDQARRAVIEAKGSELRGSGTAAARITATLQPADDQTRVEVVTDLQVTGRPAQFGGSVMAHVGDQLLGQFADRLRAELAEPRAAAAADGEGAPPPAAPATASSDVEGIDVLRLAAPLLARGALPLLAVAVVWWMLRGMRRRRR